MKNKLSILLLGLLSILSTLQAKGQINPEFPSVFHRAATYQSQDGVNYFRSYRFTPTYTVPGYKIKEFLMERYDSITGAGWESYENFDWYYNASTKNADSTLQYFVLFSPEKLGAYLYYYSSGGELDSGMTESWQGNGYDTTSQEIIRYQYSGGLLIKDSIGYAVNSKWRRVVSGNVYHYNKNNKIDSVANFTYNGGKLTMTGSSKMTFNSNGDPIREVIYDGSSGATIKYLMISFDLSTPNTVAGIDDAEVSAKNSLKLYPNPSSSDVNIELPLGSSEVNIYDLSGRIVLTQKENAASPKSVAKIKTSGFVPGLYVVKVTNAKSSWQSKFVKE